MRLSPNPLVMESLKEARSSPSKGGVPKPIGLTPYDPTNYVSGSSRLEFVRPKMVPKEIFRALSSLLKSVLDRAKDPDFSSAEERYCLPLMLNLSPSSSSLDRIPPSEEFFGQGGMVESQVSEGSESVGSQGIALTPLKILPPSSSRRSSCRELVAVEERDVQ